MMHAASATLFFLQHEMLGYYIRQAKMTILKKVMRYSSRVESVTPLNSTGE